MIIDFRVINHKKKRDLTEPKELKSYLGIDGNQLSFYLFWKKPPECISQLEKELESVFIDTGSEGSNKIKTWLERTIDISGAVIA